MAQLHFGLARTKGAFWRRSECTTRFQAEAQARRLRRCSAGIPNLPCGRTCDASRRSLRPEKYRQPLVKLMARAACMDVCSTCFCARARTWPGRRPLSPCAASLEATPIPRDHPQRSLRMKAVCWMGKEKMQVHDVPEPKILNPRDAIVRVTTTCICGSDLHLYDGMIPTLAQGDILGHEFMGEVVETGPGIDREKLKVGDRVVVPFTIACGNCQSCHDELWSLCDNSNPNAWFAEKLMGHSPSGLFGYTHMLGGYAGGQAQFVRVPFADVGPLKVADSLKDDQVVFLSDIFPTGYMAAENCNIQPGDTVAIWGCGPVGQFAIRSAFMLGAGRVIAID